MKETLKHLILLDLISGNYNDFIKNWYNDIDNYYESAYKYYSKKDKYKSMLRKSRINQLLSIPLE